MTDQQILIDAIEKAGVVIAEHIDPRITRAHSSKSESEGILLRNEC
jgi:hypothetical protein